MGYVSADHQETIGADFGCHMAALGAGIDGDMLADDGLRAD